MKGLTVRCLASPAALCLLTGPTSLWAQDVSSEDIVVTARPEPTPSEVSRQAKQIARTSGNTRRNPLARFEKPVCPGVMGMPIEMAEQVVARIRFVAEEAGVALAPEFTCRVNLLIAFVPDSLKGMRQAERVWPAMFENLSLSEKRQIYEGSGPVRVVTLKTQRTRDGTVIPASRSGPPPVVSVPLAFSKIFLTTREDIEGVVVLFEVRAVDGMSLVQIADYAAMRTFAETREPAEDVLAMDTILALFQAGATAPPSMTEFDRAFLRSLYDGLPNMPAITKVLGVNRQLRKMDADGAP